VQSLFRIKLFLVFIGFVFVISASAQASKKKISSFGPKGQGGTFLEKQWWLGFRGGLNLTSAVQEKSYAVLSPTNYPQSSTRKKYDNMSTVGSQAVVEFTFSYRSFSFSLQPTYRQAAFQYSTESTWTENGTTMLTLEYQQKQKLDLVELPFLVKFDFFLEAKVRPFIQAGAYYTWLVNANKSLVVSGVDYASGGTNRFSDPPIIVGATDLFARRQWGLMGGLGVNYNAGNVRLTMDVTYRHGMSLANSVTNRYGDQRLTGAGDVMDDIKLNSIAVSIGALFPMRYLASGFKSTF
jgi:outer membrane protein W